MDNLVLTNKDAVSSTVQVVMNNDDIRKFIDVSVVRLLTDYGLYQIVLNSGEQTYIQASFVQELTTQQTD